jgi:hypothetical protein
MLALGFPGAMADTMLRIPTARATMAILITEVLAIMVAALTILTMAIATVPDIPTVIIAIAMVLLRMEIMEAMLHTMEIVMVRTVQATALIMEGMGIDILLLQITTIIILITITIVTILPVQAHAEDTIILLPHITIRAIHISPAIPITAAAILSAEAVIAQLEDGTNKKIPSEFRKGFFLLF